VAELAHELRPLFFRMYYVVRRLTPQHQLTPTQGSVLVELVNGGPQRMSVLAEREGVRQPSMTELVRRLERLGLVTRRADPADRRAVLVEVTETGKRFVAELILTREEFLRERLTTLEPVERDAITAALPALRKLIDPVKKEELLA